MFKTYEKYIVGNFTKKNYSFKFNIFLFDSYPECS